MGGAASSPQPSPDVIAKVLSLSPLGRDLCRQAVEKSFADKEVSGAVFDRAQKAIELLIKRDNFPRFLKSGSFTEFLIALGAFGVKKQSAATGAKS